MRAFLRTLCGLIFAIAMQLGAGSAFAAITEYTDLASWQAAAGSSVVEDFSDTTLIPGLSITFGTFLPGSIGGGVYTDMAENDTGDTFSSGNPVMNYAPGTTAFGAEWDLDAQQSGLGGGLLFEVHLVGGGTASVPVFIDTLQPGFVGFVSDTSFDQIFMGTQFLDVETFSMDNARFASTSVIPLPATLPLFASGLAGLGWFSRRRRKTAAEAAH